MHCTQLGYTSEMRHSFFLLVASGMLGLALVGCGGGGSSLGSNNLSLSASRSTIAYGETVSVGWSTSDLNTSSNNGFERSNFVSVFSSLAGSGSVTDQPALSTTYRMEVRSASGSVVSRSVTVNVAPSDRAFLVVGGSATADRTTTLSLLPQITTVTPVSATSIPSPSATYDVLVLCEGGSFGPADQAQVVAWLGAGKGVVVVGGAGNQLATGDVNDPDTSAIASWFGGVSSCERQNLRVGRFEAMNAASGVQRTDRDWTDSNVLGRRVEWSESYKITAISGSAEAQTIDVNGSDITSWKFESGTGRVYYIVGLTGPAVSPGYQDAAIREVFLSGVRWAARG